MYYIPETLLIHIPWGTIHLGCDVSKLALIIGLCS